MNKCELLQLIDTLEFPKSDYYILGGGCLVIRGIRKETKDLDLCISKRLFKKIKGIYNLNNFCRNEKGFYRVSTTIEVVVEGVYPFEFDIVDGYPVQKLDILLHNKEQSGRDKDKRDVILINNYLLKNKWYREKSW